MSATEATLEKKVEKNENTALDSVRRLEETLDERHGAEEAAAARIDAAREEAGRIVREAREEAERDAAEHRRRTLARADEEAGRVIREADAEAGALLALAEGDRPAAARAVVDLVLPGPPGHEPGTGVS